MASPQTVTGSVTVRYGRYTATVRMLYGRYRYGQRAAGSGTAGQQPTGVRVRTATQPYQTQSDR